VKNTQLMMKVKSTATVMVMLLSVVVAWGSETGTRGKAGQRLTLTVCETAGLDRKNVPVRISGETLFEQSVTPGCDIRSIRLFDAANKEVPTQVVERDGTGLYVTTPNNRLDSDDELMFQLDLAPHQKKTCHLVFNGTYTSSPEYGNGEVTFKEVTISPAKPYHAELSNPYLLMGIQGREVKLYGGVSQGCITRLSQGGKELLSGNPACFWGPTQNTVVWGKPKLLAQGPVRTTVMLESEPVDAAFKRKGGAWTVTEPTRGHLKGKIFRYFHLYHGLPYLECEEIYQIRKMSAKFRSSFVFSFRTAPVAAAKRKDMLYVPLEDDGIASIKLEDKKYCGTEHPLSGWLGITGEHAHVGLALFFDYEKAVYVYGGVVRGYYRQKYIEKPWLSSDFGVTYEIKDGNPGKTVVNRFGLYVLNEQTGTEIRSLYQSLWNKPPAIKWGTD